MAVLKAHSARSVASFADSVLPATSGNSDCISTLTPPSISLIHPLLHWPQTCPRRIDAVFWTRRLTALPTTERWTHAETFSRTLRASWSHCGHTCSLDRVAVSEQKTHRIVRIQAR